MPSSPGYKRDYKQELKTQHARGELPDRAERAKLARKLKKEGVSHVGDGKDISHKKSLAKGGSNGDGYTLESPSTNRSRNGHKPGEKQ